MKDFSDSCAQALRGTSYDCRKVGIPPQGYLKPNATRLTKGYDAFRKTDSVGCKMASSDVQLYVQLCVFVAQLCNGGRSQHGVHERHEIHR